MKFIFPLLITALTSHAATPDDALRADATRTLERGVKFFRENVAVEGTYLWQYSEDLTKREGEGKATATQAWVQPPGTPAVGMAFLSAWQATSNRLFLDAAHETARGLMRGQMRSGGWHYSIQFDPTERKKIAYRLDGAKDRGRNVTTFDDDTTQAALRFLVRLDAASGFTNAPLADSISYALNAIFKAQYPNGAWPQGYEEFPDAARFPVKPASLPKEWPRAWPGSKQYWLRYTLNDNALATIVETMFEVQRMYGESRAGANRQALAARARAAALKAGDFLLLAQLPEPQPAWAQQYDADMHPCWARKFEPPAITAGESQGAIRTLMLIYRESGDANYLAPIPRALDWLRRSRLPDGRFARFYEMGSNKPLYSTKDYQLTYDDSDVPTHYAFKIADNTAAIAAEYESVKRLASTELKNVTRTSKLKLTDALREEVRSVIAAQDGRGRWVEDGVLKHHGNQKARVIRSATFNRNIETLSRYLSASQP
jgi:PelA/Pel-15E family pectate lyase